MQEILVYSIILNSLEHYFHYNIAVREAGISADNLNYLAGQSTMWGNWLFAQTINKTSKIYFTEVCAKLYNRCFSTQWANNAENNPLGYLYHVLLGKFLYFSVVLQILGKLLPNVFIHILMKWF